MRALHVMGALLCCAGLATAQPQSPARLEGAADIPPMAGSLPAGVTERFERAPLFRGELALAGAQRRVSR